MLAAIFDLEIYGNIKNTISTIRVNFEWTKHIRQSLKNSTRRFFYEETKLKT